MEVNLQQKRKGLEVKIPDIQKTLDVVRFLEARRVSLTLFHVFDAFILTMMGLSCEQCKKLGTEPTQLPKPSSSSDAGSDSEDAVVDDAEDDDLDSLDGDAQEDKEDKPLSTLYELNDTLYAEAEVDEDGNVGLWLGVSIWSHVTIRFCFFGIC
jgi:hypothetical protein